MKRAIMLSLSVIMSLVIIYFVIGYASSYVGWYGYKKWENRVATTDTPDSKARGVFIKTLNFGIDSFSGKLNDFVPYIEKGFKYGRDSAEETVELTNSNFPYQLCFGYPRNRGFGVILRQDQLGKFDSSNRTQGFLKNPNLRDTIIIDILGDNGHSGIIKIWQ